MPYIVRDRTNKVVGIYLSHTTSVIENQDVEQLSIDHPEIINFLSQAGKDDTARNLLDEYDTEVPRVLEDLIDILIRQKTIHFHDFPEEAQKKLKARETLRVLIRQADRQEPQAS